VRAKREICSFPQDVADRGDVTEVHVPSNCIGYVTGNRGSSLRQVEEDTGTFCFIASTKDHQDQLLIFGWDKEGRYKAERAINQMITEKLSNRSRSRSRSPYGRRSPSYDRYDRRRSPSYDRRERRRSPSYDRYDDRRGGGRYDDRRGRSPPRRRSRSDSRDRYRRR